MNATSPIASRCFTRPSVLALAALVCGAGSAGADQIKQVHNPSLTSFLYTGNSNVQGVRPLARQRATDLDGSARLNGAFPWAFNADPYEPGAGGAFFGELALTTGTYSPTEIDMLLPAEVPWAIGRSWNARQYNSGGTHIDSDGYQGRNWFQLSQPEIRFYDDATNSNDLIIVYMGADRFLEFKRTADSSNYFRGVNGAAGIVEHISGSPDTYVWADQRGMKTYFFGDDTAQDATDWQIWKVVDPAGNVAYAGNSSSASSAVSSGYNTDGTLKEAYDSAGRRMTYTYSSSAIGSIKRLIEVKAEINTGSWVEVGKVEYSYYESGGTTHGDIGNLKLVKVTTPLSDGANYSTTRKQYYRYYTGAFNADSNPGYPNTIKMVINPEGVRQADWDDGGSLNDSFESETTANLKSYAAAYFTYDASYRVVSAFFDGACDCGGLDGEHLFTYTDDDNFSGTSGYDSAWHHRVVIQPPVSVTAAWITQYFDETGGSLSRVLTDIDPTTASPTPKKWVTQIVRDSSGIVSEVHTPANVTGYTHDSGGNPSGAITTSDTVGAVYLYERWTSGDKTGFLKGMRQKEGKQNLTTSSTYTLWTDYTTRDLNFASGVNVTRPLVSARRAFHTAGTDPSTSANYDETTWTYTFWENTTTTDVLYITLKKVQTSSPAVATTTNGSGESTSTSVYLRQDGTMAFTESARGIVSSIQYTDGLVTKQIEDADTDTGTSYPSGEHPNTNFSITSSTAGAHRSTTYAYDAQGRLSTTTYPDGRVAVRWYAELGDERIVTFSIPRRETSGSTTYFGPVGYRVGSHMLDGGGVPPPAMLFRPGGGGMGGRGASPGGHGGVGGPGGPGGTGGGGMGGGALGGGGLGAGGAGFWGIGFLPDDCLTIAIDKQGTTTAPGGWIKIVVDFIPSDAREAFESSIGELTSDVSTVYDKTGTRVEEKRVYHAIPTSSSWVGAEGTNYDSTRYKYDNLGRLYRVKDATATIVLTTFDALGRVTARAIGLNDADETGTDDMVTAEALVYDAGNDGGNSLLTQRTVYVIDGTTDQRVTTYLHDYRGRTVVALGPVAPYPLTLFDNLGRATATGLYSSSSGLDAGDDPTALATNRVALSRTYFDARGQVWKVTGHKIDQGDGSDDDNIETFNWYDPDGSLIAMDGEVLTKTRINRRGLVFQRFTLANKNDTANTYSHVYDSTNKYADVAGDKVLEEHQVGYDTSTDEVLIEGTISREHDDTSTTGPLDTTYDGGDGDALQFLAANITGRLQATLHWYDELHRETTQAFYGTGSATGNAGTIDRDGMSAPTTSNSDKLVTETRYAYSASDPDDGSVKETEDPRDTITRYVHDDAGRVITMIANYLNGTPSGSPSYETCTDDNITRFEYAEGLMTRMWVDFDGDGTVDTTDPKDQVTDYLYEIRKADSPGPSKINANNVLRRVTYPDSASGSDVVRYAYNVQGQPIWTQDQVGNVIETDYDTLGREAARRATTVDGSFDGAVKRIATAYLTRGPVDTVTQYDAATSGNVVDQVKYSYDGWGNLEEFEHDVDSTVGGSGRSEFSVGYGYAEATGGRNTLRRTTMTLPGPGLVDFVYSSSGGKLDADASRVTRLDFTPDTGVGDPISVRVATYEYYGVGDLVGTDLPEPDARWNHFEGGSGGSELPDRDRFNRMKQSRWTGYKVSGSRDFYDLDITYDSGSNITEVVDNVHKNNLGNRNADVLYTLDALSRLNKADEGTVSSSAVSNRARIEEWTLTQTGNPKARKLDLNGGTPNYSDAGDYQEDGTFNTVNEWTKRELDTNNSAGYETTYNLVHDAAGNLTDDAENYEYKYDVFGRLREVRRTDNQNLVAEFKYNGLGMWTGWHYDVTNSSGGNPDGTVDSHDPWYWFAYDEGWKQTGTYRASDASPKEVLLHHFAGLDGYGGSSYIDGMVLRDREAISSWKSAASTRGYRDYYCQNWRADVSAILTEGGKLREWTKYSAYGRPKGKPAGDTDGDDDWDLTDAAAITGGYEVRKDTELDGDVDASDVTHANSITGGYQTLWYGVLSSTAVFNRLGYAGYHFVTPLAGAKAQVRNRFYLADLGRWSRRDPEGYVDGTSLYVYVRNAPVIASDPSGLDDIQLVPVPALHCWTCVCNTTRLAKVCVTIYTQYEWQRCHNIANMCCTGACAWYKRLWRNRSWNVCMREYGCGYWEPLPPFLGPDPAPIRFTPPLRIAGTTTSAPLPCEKPNGACLSLTEDPCAHT